MTQSYKMEVGPFARTLRRVWRDTRLAVVLPLFIVMSAGLLVLIATLSNGELFGGASFSEAAQGKSPRDLLKLLALFGSAATAFLMVSVYRKLALWMIAVAMVVLCLLLALEIPEALRPPVRPSDIVMLAATAVIALLTIDMLFALRRLLISRSPSLHHLEGFARLCRERRRRYWAIEPVKLLWLLPALVLALAAAAALQVAKAYFMVVVLEFPVSAMGSIQRFVEFMEKHPGRYAGIFLSEALQIILTILAFIYAIRFFWPLARRSAEKVIGNADYQPIVFLRSFRDEESTLNPRRAFDRLTFHRRRLEEVVVRTLAPLGPAVAVGRPGERIPRLGALRAYYSDDRWQEAVLTWIRRSYVVVVVAGQSPWALWELNHVLMSGGVDRLLLVVPPEVDAEARKTRWQKVCEAASGTLWHDAMLRQTPVGLIAVLFSSDGSVIAMTGNPAEQVDVELAMRIAAGHIAAVYAAATNPPEITRPRSRGRPNAL